MIKFTDYTGWAIVVEINLGHPTYKKETYVAFSKTKKEMLDILKDEKHLIYKAEICFIVDGIAEETYKHI